MDILAIILLIGILTIDGFKLYRELKPEREEKKVEKPKLSKEQKKKQEELRKHFENLMGYDYDEALRGDNKAD